MKRISVILFALLVNLLVMPASSYIPGEDMPAGLRNINIAFASPSKRLLSQNWDPEVRRSINELLTRYGKDSAGYTATKVPYAVFDFDNTTSIMDVGEQLAIWQLDHLAFAITPQELKSVLLTGIPEEKLSLTYGAEDGKGRQVTIKNAIDDAVADYQFLYDRGWVNPQGSEPGAEAICTIEYQDFKAKMRWLYAAIGATMDTSVSYPWVTYWFTGMTPDEVYSLAYACDSYYGDPEQGQRWTIGKYISPASGSAGQVSVCYKNGVTVTPEVKELYEALQANGFDIWINSASALEVVRAAKDYFHLAGVTGIVAMTNQMSPEGWYLNAYDYKLHPQTQGEGKVLTIEKIIQPRYHGAGPVFCAMDSQGDFNFCTEFADTRLVLVMNRQRQDDAALCAGIAAYQSDHNISLAESNAGGDIKFVLQGRNENAGVLWPRSESLLLGKQGKVFLSEKALKITELLKQGNSVREVLQANTCLKDYRGYKSIAGIP